jgi:hypothetical protein
LGYTPEQLQLAEERLFSRILSKEDQAKLTEPRNLAVGGDELIRTRLNLRDIKGETRPSRARLLVFSRTPSNEPKQIPLAAIDAEGAC